MPDDGTLIRITIRGGGLAIVDGLAYAAILPPPHPATWIASSAADGTIRFTEQGSGRVLGVPATATGTQARALDAAACAAADGSGEAVGDHAGGTGDESNVDGGRAAAVGVGRGGAGSGSGGVGGAAEAGCGGGVRAPEPAPPPHFAGRARHGGPGRAGPAPVTGWRVSRRSDTGGGRTVPVKDARELTSGYYAIEEPATGALLYRNQVEEPGLRPKPVALQPVGLDQGPLILQVVGED